MKKMKVLALLAGAMLFCGIGAVSLNAADMKCGAGKCGAAMLEKPACQNCKNMPANCKCDDKTKCTCKGDTCNCNNGKAAGKCNTGKPACQNCKNMPANCKCDDKTKCTCKGEKCNCNNGKALGKCNTGKVEPQGKCNNGR